MTADHRAICAHRWPLDEPLEPGDAVRDHVCVRTRHHRGMHECTCGRTEGPLDVTEQYAWCHAEIERDGELDACGAEAIALRLFDLQGEPPWPACDEHASPARYLGGGRWAVS